MALISHALDYKTNKNNYKLFPTKRSITQLITKRYTILSERVKFVKINLIKKPIFEQGYAMFIRNMQEKPDFSIFDFSMVKLHKQVNGANIWEFNRHIREKKNKKAAFDQNAAWEIMVTVYATNDFRGDVKLTKVDIRRREHSKSSYAGSVLLGFRPLPVASLCRFRASRLPASAGSVPLGCRPLPVAVGGNNYVHFIVTINPSSLLPDMSTLQPTGTGIS